jgi:integrase/recombinase XerD
MPTKSTAKPLTLATVQERFSTYLYAKCRLGEVTVNNYLGVIRRALPVLGLKPTQQAVEKYVADMRRKHASQSHVVNTSIALERYGQFIHVPVKVSRPPKMYALVKNTLSEAEIARLIAASRNLREKAMLCVLAYTGMRVREFCAIRTGDLDVNSQVLHIQGFKQQKDRAVVVASPCLTVLAEYIAQRGGKDGELMFITVRNKLPLEPQDIRKLLKVVAKRAKITKRVHPHILRHSLAVNLIARGTGILAVKEQLGHVFIATTMRYLYSAPARLQEEYRMHVPSYL